LSKKDQIELNHNITVLRLRSQDRSWDKSTGLAVRSVQRGKTVRYLTEPDYLTSSPTIPNYFFKKKKKKKIKRVSPPPKKAIGVILCTTNMRVTIKYMFVDQINKYFFIFFLKKKTMKRTKIQIKGYIAKSNK